MTDGRTRRVFPCGNSKTASCWTAWKRLSKSSVRVVGWMTLDECSFSFRTRVSSEGKGPWTVCAAGEGTRCCKRPRDMEGKAMVIDKTTVDVLFLTGTAQGLRVQPPI